MTLRARLALVLAGFVVVAVFAGAFSAQVSTDRQLRGEIDQLLRDRSRQIETVIERSPAALDRLPADFLARTPGFNVRGTFDSNTAVQLLGSSGIVLGSSSPIDVVIPVSPGDRERAAGDGRESIRTEEVDGVRYRILTSPLEGGGAIQVARSLGEVEAVLGGVQRRLLLVALVIGSIAALIGWVLTRRMTTPVLQLAEAAEMIAATQDLSVPVRVVGSDEIGRLAMSFNTMLLALRESRHQQHELVMDASHELRTPLTSLRTNIELLQRGSSLDATQRGELLDASVEELSELTDLVSELVELATDSREVEDSSPFDLVATVTSVVERVQRRSDRVVEVSGVEVSCIVARPAMIERAVTNLIENAVKFSPAGSPVSVMVGTRSVQVRDRGPGIPDSDKSRIFDRFYRTTATRGAPGSGLGLAIVKQTVEAHGGVVFVTDNPEGGAIVGFELPESILG